MFEGQTVLLLSRQIVRHFLPRRLHTPKSNFPDEQPSHGHMGIFKLPTSKIQRGPKNTTLFFIGNDLCFSLSTCKKKKVMKDFAVLCIVRFSLLSKLVLLHCAPLAQKREVNAESYTEQKEKGNRKEKKKINL